MSLMLLAATAIASGTALPAPCDALSDFEPRYAADVDRFQAQDEAGSTRPGGLVFVGSSSIRRWAGLARAYADHRPIQRGIGGAELAEVALHSRDLVLRHDPRGVVVFAGTNDVAAGVPAEDTIARFQCLRAVIAEAHGPTRPVFFIGITPTLARWSRWSEAEAVNQAVADLAASDPGLVYVDVPATFLATGSPPARDLFAADGLHLSIAGYALWDGVLRDAVDRVLAPDPMGGAAADAPPAGTRVLLALMPGAQPTGTGHGHDGVALRWNRWPGPAVRGSVLAGEHVDGLETVDGQPTALSVVATGDLRSQGRLASGLAVRGLDPAASHALRLCARPEPGPGVPATWTVHGEGTRSATLSSSASAEPDGSLVGPCLWFEALRPDPWGQLFIDVPEGPRAAPDLASLELVVQ